VNPVEQKRKWIAPSFNMLSVKETRATNGSDSDAQGGGVFLHESPDKPPKKIGIPPNDGERIRDFLRAISSSQDKLEAAIFDTETAMTDMGLTENQIKMAKRILQQLGR
jgi:hypothetical protein